MGTEEDKRLDQFNIADLMMKMRDVYAYSGYLSNKYSSHEDDERELERIILKLKLLSIIQSKYVIGISGFQGSGKSTMLNHFLFDQPFGADQGWFPQNLGVGENLPILITISSAAKKISAKLIKLEKASKEYSYQRETFIIEEEIDDPKIARQHASNPSSDSLLIEIMVPMADRLNRMEKSSYLDNLSFLLLPGYEVIGEDTDNEKIFRQEYMKLALNACASTIITIDPRTVMQKTHENALNGIMQEFSGARVLYALTHADSNENIQDAVTALKRRYKIDSDHIVKTGTPNAVFTGFDVDRWREAMIEKMAGISSRNHTLRPAQIKSLKKIVRACRSVIRNINDSNNRVEIDVWKNDEQITSLLTPFDDSARRITEKLLEHYTVEVRQALSETFVSLERENYDESHGRKFKDWIKKKFKGPEPTSVAFGMFKKSLKSKIENKGGDRLIALRSVNKAQKSLGVYSDLMTDGTDKAAFKKDALAHTESPKKEFALDEGVIRNIQFLIGSERIVNSTTLSEPDRDFKRATKLIPYLMFEMQRFELGKGEKLDFEKLTAGVEHAEKSTIDYFEKNAGAIKGFAAALVSLVGADYLPDGELNNLGGIFTSLFGANATTTTATGGVALSSGAVIGVGVIAGLVILKSLNDDMLSHGLRRVAIFSDLKRNTEQTMIQDMRNKMNDMFSCIRNMIIYRLESYAFKNSDSGSFLKLKHAIDEASHSINLVTEQLGTRI